MSTYELEPNALGDKGLPAKKRAVRPITPVGKPDLRKPLWPTPPELEGRGWLCAMAFLAILGLYGWMLIQYHVAAHPGVDQNGYLMTARLIAGERNAGSPLRPTPFPTLTPQVAGPVAPGTAPTVQKPTPQEAVRIANEAILAKDAASPVLHPKPVAAQEWPTFDWLRNRLSFVPDSPYQFAGRMCIMTEPFGPPSTAAPSTVRIYAKYPFGFPLMAAVARLMAGADAMYWVNPLCTILACYFAYFLFRQAVSPFLSLLGVVWLACNPLVLFYGNDANSHASTLFCVTMGFWGLLSWLRTGQNWRAWIGGLGLGYACCIRYSEFLLVMPVTIAALLNFRFTWRRFWGSLSLMTAWAIPVAVLAGVCWVCFGLPWKTGYTYCHESTGFAWKYLVGDFGSGPNGRQGNWETLMVQMNRTGLFVLWPLAIAGMFGMLGSAWRLGSIITAWVLPSAILYMLYYWAPGGDVTMGYLRFFVSIIPGLIFAGLWMLDRGLVLLKGETKSSLWMITGFGAVLLIVVAMVYTETPVVGGAGFIKGIGTAVWTMACDWWVGSAITAGIAVMVVGIWVFDWPYASERVGMALGAGILTAIGCGVNLDTAMPQIDWSYSQYAQLKDTVDNVRVKVPTGSMIFADDKVLDQLDCNGGWNLVSAGLFKQFPEFKRRVDNRDKDADSEDDPDPIQGDRCRYYMELLGKLNDKGEWVDKSWAEQRDAECGVIDQALAAGHRVFFVWQNSDAPRARTIQMGPLELLYGAQYNTNCVWQWMPSPADDSIAFAGGRWRQGVKNRNQPIARFSGRMCLYEVTKKAVPTTAATKK